MKFSKLGLCVLFSLLMLLIPTLASAHGRVVEAGDTGPYVEEVQTLLKEKGYYKEEITGKCDEATVEAIKAFQRDNALEVDGVAGPKTMRVLNPLTMDNIDLSNARVMVVYAYAYSPQDPGMGSHTASGTPLRRGVIAVDPSYIPLGTRVYIPDYGEAIAEDIGGNITGHTIDIAFDTHQEALLFGCQTIEIYILD